MSKIKEKLAERRGYIRLREPVSVSYTVPGRDKLYTVMAGDISADGLRLRIADRDIKEGDLLEMKLGIPAIPDPVRAKGRIMWKRKLSLEDAAPFDAGVEITGIEEDDKNTFLKFLCDLIYDLPEDRKNAESREK